MVETEVATLGPGAHAGPDPSFAFSVAAQGALVSVGAIYASRLTVGPSGAAVSVPAGAGSGRSNCGS